MRKCTFKLVQRFFFSSPLKIFSCYRCFVSAKQLESRDILLRQTRQAILRMTQKDAENWEELKRQSTLAKLLNPPRDF